MTDWNFLKNESMTKESRKPGKIEISSPSYLMVSITDYHNLVSQGFLTKAYYKDDNGIQHLINEQYFTSEISKAKAEGREEGKKEELEFATKVMKDHIELARAEEVQRIRNQIGFLRQWLNEDRISDPRKLVTNELLEKALGLSKLTEERE